MIPLLPLLIGAFEVNRARGVPVAVAVSLRLRRDTQVKTRSVLPSYPTNFRPSSLCCILVHERVLPNSTLSTFFCCVCVSTRGSVSARVVSVTVTLLVLLDVTFLPFSIHLLVPNHQSSSQQDNLTLDKIKSYWPLDCPLPSTHIRYSEPTDLEPTFTTTTHASEPQH